MSLSIRSPKDFWLGVIYAAAGAAGFLIARDYPFGSGARMGAGYFPAVVSSLLFVFGIVAIARSLIFDGEAIGAVAYKAVGFVLGSLVAFALLVDGAGFVVAALAMLLLCAAASGKFRFEAGAMLGAIGLVAACSVVFIRWLGVPMPLVGPWLKPWLPVWLGG